MIALERIPDGEADLIRAIVDMTRRQMERRYPPGTAALRGQHAKEHGCLNGTLTVREDLPANLQRGVFTHPGHHYAVRIRYSNAAAAVGADSAAGTAGTSPVHGSRGMAIRILEVPGVPLIATTGAVDQDFLLVNHPVFPFANVEDYEALTRVTTADSDDPARFFTERIHMRADGNPDVNDPVTRRTLRTLGIARRIQSASVTAQPAAFQDPPASPLDNQYFGAGPFMFGQDKVMRMRVTPVVPPMAGTVDLADPDYLRAALRQRFAGDGIAKALFNFDAQVRSAADLAEVIDTDIEDATADWDEAIHPFVTLAVVAIPPQDVDAADGGESCESTAFSPWHGIEAHRPLGGINRLRRAVYEASSTFRTRQAASLR